MQLSDGTAQRLVDQLDHAQDIASEARILRWIKNNLTGHELRKITYIRAGLIPVLTEVLSSHAHHLRQTGDAAQQQFHLDEEAVWWQASSIIIVLANAGTAFTYALLGGSLISLLTGRLRITKSTDRVTTNILLCLNTFAENLPLDDSRYWAPDSSLASSLYSPENALCLSKLAAPVPDTSQAQQQLEIVLKLIRNTCHSENHVSVLDELGLLDILCNQFAAQIWHAADGPNEELETVNGTRNADRTGLLVLILDALALLVTHSRSKANRLATNISIQRAIVMAVATPALLERLGSPDVFPTDLALDEHDVRDDYRLPLVPDLHAMYFAKKSTWPPLAHSTDRPVPRSRRQSPNKAYQINNTATQPWHELHLETRQTDTVVLWLLHLVRSARREVRIMAARLLVVLKSHNILSARTVRSLATLLVPILVEMLDRQAGVTNTSSSYAERVPAILALLVKDQEDLQQAAVEAKAIPMLAVALKSNFECLQNASSELWWPTKLQEKLTSGIRDRSLGPGGPCRTVRLQMQMREGLLQALAALAPDSDIFRKDICDQGALNHIVLALEPFHSHTVLGEHYDRISIAGNSAEALIAACGAVRALTRSPTSLRTKIVDADVTKHVVNLLYTSDVAVRLAATKVIANLSHGFSPTKNHIAEPNVIKKLCEQAHSAHAELRKETLFALKAFINLCSNNLKKLVVEELGINWIRDLMATDPHSVPNGEVIGLVEKDHRKGSVVNKSEDTDMHDAESMEPEEDIKRYNRHTPEQDLEILAELLGFLRNLTTGEQPSAIIDFVLGEIGHDEFMQMIVDRLKGISNGYPRLSAKIVENCIYILAHLAIADARYRSLVADNLILMKQVNTFLGHTESSIRRACCWLIIGVVYSTNESYSAAASRAHDLQRLGVVANLKRMEKSDLDTDVKERASTACDIFTKLLDKN